MSDCLANAKSINNFSSQYYLVVPKNPAITKAESTLILGVENSNSNIDFTDQSNNISENESYGQQNNRINLGMAFSNADVGVQAYVTKDSYRGLYDSEAYEEASDQYDILTSIQMSLIDSLFIGFSMNWNIASGNIYGNDVGEGNDLEYTQRITQMTAGINYDNDRYAFGLFYGFLGKGKFDVSGEDKLLTSPSTFGFNSKYRFNNKIAAGLSYVKYEYGEDETRQRYTNDNDSRISLKGLGFEAYHYYDYLARADLQYSHNARFYGNFGLIFDKGFYYTGSDESEISSGDQSSNLSYELMAHYEFNKLYIEAMVQLNQKSVGQISDNDSKNGYSLIENYKLSNQTFGFSVGVPF